MAKQKIPSLVGVSGYSKGEKFPLKYGKALVVGRSRSADFSMRRLKAYLALPQDQRDADEAFRTVSGKHFQVTMYNLGSIEVKNLSMNGTYVDGKPIDTVIIEDVADEGHKIEIGMEEKFMLQMEEHEVSAEGDPVDESAVQELSEPDEISSPEAAPVAEHVVDEEPAPGDDTSDTSDSDSALDEDSAIGDA